MMASKQPKVAGAARVVHKHPYRGDGIPDHHGQDRCGDCGLEWDHRVHKLDPVDPEVAETTSRITGERGAGE